jgi:hypothetical protein
MADKNGLKLIVAFVGRGEGRALARFFKENQIPLSFHGLGRGTASSELMDVLGLGTAEKDILFGMASDAVANKAMQTLGGDPGTALNAKGIVFDLKVTGLNNIIAAVLLHTGAEQVGGMTMEQTGQDASLILITVNQGYTDEVMDTARAAGARGGTIIRARWSGDQENEQLLGIHIQAEKEIIAIVTKTENRNVIMETINMKHGLNTNANAMICSLGIDQTVRL